MARFTYMKTMIKVGWCDDCGNPLCITKVPEAKEFARLPKVLHDLEGGANYVLCSECYNRRKGECHGRSAAPRYAETQVEGPTIPGATTAGSVRRTSIMPEPTKVKPGVPVAGTRSGGILEVALPRRSGEKD